MDTAQQALFRAMFKEGWFTKTSGEDDFGYSFGYVTNSYFDVNDIVIAFSDVIDAYGKPALEDIEGVYYAILDSNGVFELWRNEGPFYRVEGWYEDNEERYAHWLNTVEV